MSNSNDIAIKIMRHMDARRLIAVPWKIFQDRITMRRVENSYVTRVRGAHAEHANARLINNRVSDK